MADRRRALSAMIVLCGVSWSLRIVGLKRCQSWLWRRLPKVRSIDLSHLEEQVTAWEWAVRVAARNVPCRARCLEQSLTLWYVLCRRRIDAVLRIGVRKADTQTVEAHAWVEIDGRPINDRPDIAQSYSPFEGPLPRAAELQ